jgi:hypothetical protein
LPLNRPLREDDPEAICEGMEQVGAALAEACGD